MSKKNFTIWIVIFVVTFLLGIVGRRLVGFEVDSSLVYLILIFVPIVSFLMLKKK